MLDRSLPRCYTNFVPDVRALPLCLHLNDPGTAAARFRFHRAHLNYNSRGRMNYSDTNVICTHCNMRVKEATTHLL